MRAGEKDALIRTLDPRRAGGALALAGIVVAAVLVLLWSRTSPGVVPVAAMVVLGAGLIARRGGAIADRTAARLPAAPLDEWLGDAILHCDADGVCTHATGAIRAVFGVAPAALVGDRPSARILGDARERIGEIERRILSGAVQLERFTYRRLPDAADGSPVFVDAVWAALRDPRTGKPDGFAIVARNATERVEREWQIARAQREAALAARAKSEFLARMSHEVRTPMTGVLGCAELLLESELDPDQRRHARMIVESGRSMMMILGDIIDLSRIETGEIAVDYAPVDLRATIRQCAALHRPNAERKGLALVCEFVMALDEPTDAASSWVVTDAMRLKQIVLNLIDNAVRFTDSGAIRVRCTLEPEQFSVEVADTGSGIEPARLARIFQPFGQNQHDPMRREGGSGLGLAIGRQLAGLLGGSITVESAPGEGSRFTLTLPGSPIDTAPGPDGDAAIALALPDPAGSQSLVPARILLVEGHDMNRMVIRELLERCGQNVAIAHDGTEAIAMVFDAAMRQRPYDLVLMDLQMPGCDGRAAARAIRQEGIAPERLPIIALSAKGVREDRAALRAAGMQDQLAKPVELAALARMLQRWMPSRIVEMACE